MKISVVTVCLNAEKYIARCCKSVASQTWSDLEHLVVDGGSVDRTLDLVAQYARTDVRIHSGPDAGIYDAMNKAIALCTGDAILFLNADDWFAHDEALAMLGQALVANPGVGITYGDALVIDRGAVLFKGQGNIGPGNIGFEMICHQTILARKSVFSEHGGFDTGYRLCGDMDWVMRAADQHVGLMHVPTVVCFYSAGGESDRALAKRLAEKQQILTTKRSSPRRLFQRTRLAIKRRLQVALAKF